MTNSEEIAGQERRKYLVEAAMYCLAADLTAISPEGTLFRTRYSVDASTGKINNVRLVQYDPKRGLFSPKNKPLIRVRLPINGVLKVDCLDPELGDLTKTHLESVVYDGEVNRLELRVHRSIKILGAGREEAHA